MSSFGGVLIIYILFSNNTGGENEPRGDVED